MAVVVAHGNNISANTTLGCVKTNAANLTESKEDLASTMMHRKTVI